jgi:hypothetical protein
MSWATSSPGMAISKEPEGAEGKEVGGLTPPDKRQKIVVVGLGMVGVAFMYRHTQEPGTLS